MKSLYLKYISFICMPISALTLSSSGLSEDLLIGNTTYKPYVVKAGSGGLAIDTGDFNKDGFRDLVITNKADSEVAIYLGDKAGKLSKTNSYEAGHEPSEIVASDINGDDKLDLVIANHETKYLTLLNGKGDGSFIPAKSSPFSIKVSPHPHIVRVEDVNGDNKVDLVVDSRDNSGLLLLKGQGNSSFEALGDVIYTGGDPYLGFTMGDINRDGIVDFASPNTNNVSIVLGKDSKSQSFSEPLFLPINSPFAVELADMDGDGCLDLIVASISGLITIVKGEGNGKFKLDKKTEIEFSRGAKRIAIGDINNDGISDALVSNWSSEVIVITGSNSSFKIKRFKPQGIRNPWMSKVTDMNNDKKSDLIISDGDGNQVVVYLSETSNEH